MERRKPFFNKAVTRLVFIRAVRRLEDTDLHRGSEVPFQTHARLSLHCPTSTPRLAWKE
jgi:hypothetical protein